MPFVGRDLGERGMGEAFDRLTERITVNADWEITPDGWEIPLFECLQWMYALHEIHKDVHGAAYLVDPGGMTLRAVVWARNFSAHELFTVAHPDMTQSGLTGMSMVGRGLLGAASGPEIWTAESGLHEAPPLDIRNLPRRQLYSQLVEGRRLLEPLTEVRDYLLSLP